MVATKKAAGTEFPSGGFVLLSFRGSPRGLNPESRDYNLEIPGSMLRIAPE